jgi:ribonucleoside-triphosphate reductase
MFTKQLEAKSSGEVIMGTRQIVDLMNLIGKCVVSGNIRRTAEIAFGECDDEEFINLKNYEMNPERMAFGWVSNNSIFAKVG